MTDDDQTLASKLAGLSALADNINTTTAALDEDDERVTDVLRSLDMASTTDAELHEARVNNRLHRLAAAREAAYTAWLDSHEQGTALRPDSSTWTVDVVAELLKEANDVQDVAAFRALANRIAYRSTSPRAADDAKTMLVHLARATGAVAAATADITLMQTAIDTHNDGRAVNEFGLVIVALVDAASRLEQFARERL